MQRAELTLPSGCAAWLYRPVPSPAPCLVMAPGFSALRSDGLPQFAERFARAGVATLLFDYLHFGDSAGEPRQLVDVNRQLQNWHEAVAFARRLPGIDPLRIGLFGTSFSGGHVLSVAAADSAIAAVIAQCPFLDGLVTLLRTRPWSNLLRGTLCGLWDVLGSALGLGGCSLPVAGPPGSFAAMNAPEALPGFQAMLAPGSAWRNEVRARIVLTLPLYRPILQAPRVRCPALLCLPMRDQTTPPELAVRAAHRMPHAEVRRYDFGHFDVYHGSGFEQVISDQLEFVQRTLLP